jgi:peptidoglycan/LPS O-acetylase OafA/YrhL
MNSDQIERFLEFVVIGVVMGTVEDLIAVKLATGKTIDLSMIFVVIAVAVPFAAFSELVVDKPDIRPLRKTAEKIEEKLKSAV